MPKYSKQDLEYAAELREEIHREALAIVRKTRPDISEVTDRHPVEDYFQESWEYPGRSYTVVAILYGYKSRRAFVEAIVRDTLSGDAPEKELYHSEELQNTAKTQPGQKISTNQLLGADGKGCFAAGSEDVNGDDPFYRLLAEYPDLEVEYFIVKGQSYCGYASHKRALKTAFGRICGEWNGDTDKAKCKSITAGDKFLSKQESGKLNYRKAFLCPPHGNSYTDGDFRRVNAALFPNGTAGLEVYNWSTDWSDYFEEGHEWWGALCLTVYDKTLDRFVVIMASATD